MTNNSNNKIVDFLEIISNNRSVLEGLDIQTLLKYADMFKDEAHYKIMEQNSEVVTGEWYDV